MAEVMESEDFMVFCAAAKTAAWVLVRTAP
jgi:hypothetical protein